MLARTSHLCVLILCFVSVWIMAAHSSAATGPMFDGLVLVDEVNCGDANDPHAFHESAAGVSQIQTILGRSCRAMPNIGDTAKYFSYRIGVGKGLVAGKAYLLTVDYPEDQPRSVVILNSGCEQTNGFHTGTTLGDALHPPYINPNAESLNLPLSGEWQTWQTLFHLHDRFGEVQEERNDGVRPYGPANGFWVTVAHFASSDDPTSMGPAASHIRLYEAPDIAAYTQSLNLPPAALPQRHLMWREEMADQVLNGSTPGVSVPWKWHEYKIRLMKFLGMNTYGTDLLEFGHNQGWDTTPHGGASWYQISPYATRWQDIVAMIGNYPGISLLPYYEYCGSMGTGPLSLGTQKRCEPLNKMPPYTHISWSEGAYCDVTDPDFVTDVQNLLDCTINRVVGGHKPQTPNGVTGGMLQGYCAGAWGYIDLGANWQNWRIRETWTQSRANHTGPPSPMANLYWYNGAPSNFISGGQHVIPAGAVRETRFNFITQTQSDSYVWTRDTLLSEGQEVTPQGRYLVVQTGTPLTDASELAFVGYLAGTSTTLTILPPVGGGPLKAVSSDPWMDLTSCFDGHPVLMNTDAPLIGAWFRTRMSNMPVSFAEAARQRYSNDRRGGVLVSKAQISASSTIYADYLDWWFLERRDFLNAIRDYLRASGRNDQADVLFTWDANETGVNYPDWNAPHVIAENVSTWTALGETAMTLSAALAADRQLYAMTSPQLNWSNWEWNHSLPEADPQNYVANDGVMMTHTINKAYTVGSSNSFNAFRTPSGLAVVRHYCLNEDAMEPAILGYFVGDVNLAGPHTMLPEARSMAYGDPRYIGYLTSSSYNRGFPQYVRNFNAAFLALPALPSTVLAGATSNANVIVRSINAGQYGTYLAVVNVGYAAADNVTITLPAGGAVTDAAAGEPIAATDGQITLSMYSCQLRAIHIDSAGVEPLLGDFNGDGTVTHGDYTVWADHYGQSIAAVQAEHPGWFPVGSYLEGSTTVTQGLYTTWADHFGDTVNDPLAVTQPNLPAAAQAPAGGDSLSTDAAPQDGLTPASARQQRRAERVAARRARLLERRAARESARQR